MRVCKAHGKHEAENYSSVPSLYNFELSVNYFRSRSYERFAWLACSLSLRQPVSEKKKISVVSRVIIRDEKATINSRGRNYPLSTGYATGLAILGDTVSFILSRLHNLAAMRGCE